VAPKQHKFLREFLRVREMKSKVWIVVGLVLATIVAISGNIIAGYLQASYELTDPTWFGFAATLFLVCLIAFPYISLKRLRWKHK
jgi:hypothetical protein